MQTNIGIDAKNLTAITERLNTLLADEYVLYTKTRNYHWNVTGPHFRSMHELFEEQYEDLAEKVDGVAERVRALGGRPFGTLKEFTQAARLQEQPGRAPKWNEMVSDLLKDHEAIVRTLRTDSESIEEMGDSGTADFLIGMMEEHEKTAWMLRAHITEG